MIPVIAHAGALSARVRVVVGRSAAALARADALAVFDSPLGFSDNRSSAPPDLMPDRPQPEASTHAEAPPDRDAKIEELLLTGLDHYFSGQYEQAINVWTRVLFLDRGHARARAYIERARSALAERQRESDELLQVGLAALDRGDLGKARDLLTSALERGGPQDEALAVLYRLSRLETVTGGPSEGERHTRPPERSSRAALFERRTSPARRPVRAVPLLLLLAVIAGAAYAVTSWDELRAVLPMQRIAPQTVVRPGPESPVPVPSVGEIALARARALFERGRLHDALRLLNGVRSGDPLKPEADQLRATIQRALVAATELEATGPAADFGRP